MANQNPSTEEIDLFDEDFTGGLDCTGADAKWVLRPTATRPHGDGIPAPTAAGLVVVPTARDPATGLPAFAMDPVQEGGAGHLRWAAFANRHTDSGAMGFTLPERGELSAWMTLSAELYNTSRHPYGAQVSDPDISLRCGMAAMICVDMESGLVFDFAVTNRRVWALYERLPRPGRGHGTFSYAVPVAERDPGDAHRFDISLDAAIGRVRWSLNGSEVFAVEEIGRRLPSDDHLARSSAGPEERLTPQQLSFGFGLFADPVWGQGARLTVSHAQVRANLR